jgi:hypothetical protein
MRAAVACELRHHFGGGGHQPLPVALAGDLEPPAVAPGRIAPAEELAHRVGADPDDTQTAQIQQREESARTAVVKALGLARHRSGVGLDLLPRLRLEVSGDPRRGLGGPLARQGQRVAGEVPACTSHANITFRITIAWR